MAALRAASRYPSNIQIAGRLDERARMLRAQGENPYKVQAYRRAAATVRKSRESIGALVQQRGDPTQFPGIGKGIAAALRTIVLGETAGQMEFPLAVDRPEGAIDYPRGSPTVRF